MTNPNIQGGSCPVLPMQFCIIWTVTQKKVITILARDVWFASLEVQFWRSNRNAEQIYCPSPRGFRVADVAKFLGLGESKLYGALRQLERTNIMRVTEEGIWFAKSLSDITVPALTKTQVISMFDKLHPSTRDKTIAVPRRLLKLIVGCRRKTVRLATLLGLVLRIMLEKRTEKYDGYKGCCKAQWIADVFGVGVDRVKSERRKLISEGWFEEEPTSPRIQKRFGLWLKLNLRSPRSTLDFVDNSSMRALSSQMQPQNRYRPLKLQPLINQKLPSKEGNNNQKLEKTLSTGIQNEQPNSSWKNITNEDLQDPYRSIALFDNAVSEGILRHTDSDRLTFFAAIARAKHKATNNVCGFVRRLIESPEYHGFISQNDEDTARRWLNEIDFHIPYESVDSPQIMQPALSKDAFIVQVLTQDLEQAGYRSDLFALIQHSGYLIDWSRERWDKAKLELTVRPNLESG